MAISKKRLQEIASIPDEAIDTSDIPEAKEDFFAKAKWCGTPMIEEEEKPEAIFFYCKDGSIKTATMEQGFEPCEDCDCGWKEAHAL